jgi:hypothetical protein
MFGFNQDNLVSQAINCGLVKDLLAILSSRLDNIKNASACKAQVRIDSFLIRGVHLLIP